MEENLIYFSLKKYNLSSFKWADSLCSKLRLSQNQSMTWSEHAPLESKWKKKKEKHFHWLKLDFKKASKIRDLVSLWIRLDTKCKTTNF